MIEKLKTEDIFKIIEEDEVSIITHTEQKDVNIMNKINEIIDELNKEVEVKIKFDKENPGVLPVKNYKEDAGYDLVSTEDSYLGPGNYRAISTGIYLEIPNGYEAQIRPRSGLSIKHGITVINSPGTVDSLFRGEIKVLLLNQSNTNFHIEKGMRIAQMVFSKVLNTKLIISKKINKTKRGNKGLGSSGLK